MKKFLSVLLALCMVISVMPAALAAGTAFTDVDTADWFADEVEYVYDNGLMTGVGDNTFDPDGTVTRAMVWTTMARIAGVSTKGSDPWYEAGQKWAMKNDVSDGTGALNNVTREQLVTMLYRYVGSPKVTASQYALLASYPDADKVSDWAEDAVAWALKEGILNGMDGKLNPQGDANRAQLAAILYRYVEKVLEAEEKKEGTGDKISDYAHFHEYGEWATNNDGTHSRVCTCTDTETVDCTYVDGVCSVCGYEDGAVAMIGETYYKTLPDAIAAAQNGDMIIVFEGTYQLPDEVDNKEITIVAAEDENVIINIWRDRTNSADKQLYARNSILTFKNVTIASYEPKNSNDWQHAVLAHATKVTFEGCKFVNPLVTQSDVAISECEFITTNDTAYNLYLYGGDEWEISDTTFSCAGKSVLIYAESHYTADGVATFNDCTFTASQVNSGKAAIEIDSSLIKGSYTININGIATGKTASTGFDNGSISGNSLWNQKKGNKASIIIDGAFFVADQSALETAITAGKTNIVLADDNYIMPQNNALQGKTLTISGTKDAVVDIGAIPTNGSQAFSGTTLVFDGVTVNAATTIYKGFTHAKSLTYKNCQINGTQYLYADEVIFENCDFDSKDEEHSVCTYGADKVTFTGCDFTYADRAVNVYLDNGKGSVDVSFDGCTFTSTNTASKGAVEINSSVFPQGANVSFVKCTAPANGDMVGISGWDSTNGATANVTVGGNAITAPQWTK